MGLCAVSTQLLGQGSVSVAEGGHQVGAVLHRNLAGTGADGDAPPSRACGRPWQSAEHVNGLLHLDGHLLGLGGLLNAQAGERHGGRRGAVLRLLLLEDCTAGGQALKVGGRRSTWGERNLGVTEGPGHLQLEAVGASEETQTGASQTSLCHLENLLKNRFLGSNTESWLGPK